MPLRYCLSRLLFVLAVTAAPLGAAQAARTNVPTSARMMRPIVLTARQDLDFGQILLPTTAGTHTVSISMAGVRSCGTGLSCSGVARQAVFNLVGSNNQAIRVTAVATPMVNAAGASIVMTPIAPASVTLSNAGNGGQDFGVGGSISVTSATADGVYSGSLEVTVDYQ